MNKQSFVMYESVYQLMERLHCRKMYNEELSLIRAVIEYGLYGVIPNDDDDLWLYGLDQILTSINAAKERYNISIENGKKGGRPQTIDRNKVAELKSNGLTNMEVAQQLNCSVSAIEKINRELKKNHVITVPNLNENVNINVNENEKENEKDNVSGKRLTTAFSAFSELGY